MIYFSWNLLEAGRVFFNVKSMHYRFWDGEREREYWAWALFFWVEEERECPTKLCFSPLMGIISLTKV